MRDSLSAWPIRLVGELVTDHYSGPSPTCEERNIRSEAEWGLLKTTAITWSGWDEMAHKVPPAAYNDPSIEVKAGDVLITKAGPRHRVGVVVHVHSTRPRLMVSGKMVGLRPDSLQVESRVLAGLLATAEPQQFLDHRTTGMAESQVNFANSALLSTPVRLPPLREQRKIAELLDTVDEAIRKTEAIIAKLKQVKQGLLHDLLTRGIDDNGELRDPDRHPEQFKDSPLGSTPKTWTVRTLAELATAPICYGIVQAGPYHPDGPFVLMIRNLNGDYRQGLHRTSPTIEESYSRSRVLPEDVLLSIKGTIGRVGVVPSWFTGNISRDLARLRLGTEIVPAFCVDYLRSDAGARRLELSVVGTTRAEISIHVLKKLTMPVPPREEQFAIAERVKLLDRRIQAETDEQQKMVSVKQGLMEDLLTGRVRVTELLAKDSAA
jgi:type I restriction enzyme S subunit